MLLNIEKKIQNSKNTKPVIWVIITVLCCMSLRVYLKRMYKNSSSNYLTKLKKKINIQNQYFTLQSLQIKCSSKIKQRNIKLSNIISHRFIFVLSHIQKFPCWLIFSITARISFSIFFICLCYSGFDLFW